MYRNKLVLVLQCQQAFHSFGFTSFIWIHVIPLDSHHLFGFTSFIWIHIIHLDSRFLFSSKPSFLCLALEKNQILGA